MRQKIHSFIYPSTSIYYSLATYVSIKQARFPDKIINKTEAILEKFGVQK